jgi:hypothetical protein
MGPDGHDREEENGARGKGPTRENHAKCVKITPSRYQITRVSEAFQLGIGFAMNGS